MADEHSSKKQRQSGGPSQGAQRAKSAAAAAPKRAKTAFDLWKTEQNAKGCAAAAPGEDELVDLGQVRMMPPPPREQTSSLPELLASACLD